MSRGHMRERGLSQVEERAEVHGEGTVPLLVGDVFELVVRPPLCGVANQDVDPAELGDRRIDDRPAVFRVGKIPGTSTALRPASASHARSGHVKRE
jgi:hypothetical protein